MSMKAYFAAEGITQSDHDAPAGSGDLVEEIDV